MNESLATEIVCVLRYKRHYYLASGINSDGAKAEFLQHANGEQQYADWIATRITQLYGEPNFSPDGLLLRSHSEYAEGKDITSMLKEDLSAERIAIESYSEIVRWLGNDDPTSRKMIEENLKQKKSTPRIEESARENVLGQLLTREYRESDAVRTELQSRPPSVSGCLLAGWYEGALRDSPPMLYERRSRTQTP